MLAKILVIAEQNGESITRHSREVITAAQQLQPQELVVALLGDQGGNAVQDASFCKVNSVCVVEHELLQQYSADGYCSALQQLIASEQPQMVLLANSYQARDYIPKLSARLGRSVISDCVNFDHGDDVLGFVRQVFQGRVTTCVDTCAEAPTIVSLQAGNFDPDTLILSETPVEIMPLQAELAVTDIRSESEAPFRESAQTVDLGQAEIIVAVGRAIKDPKNLEMVQTFASLIGAEVAASRPVCDEGWLPIDRQVGSSGQSVAPKLYIAVGISGAIQHVIGMKASSTIVAINKDPNAPIFKIADYGIVGDLFEILPALISQLQADG